MIVTPVMNPFCKKLFIKLTYLGERIAKMLLLSLLVRSGSIFSFFNGLEEEDFWPVFDLFSEDDDF